MEGETSHIVYSVNVIEFVTVANEYCATLETMDDLNRKDFVHKMQKIFPLLYLKASLLPEVEEMLEDEPEKFVAEEDYNYLHRKLQVKLAEHDGYLEVFDPLIQYSEGPVEGSLAENMADIYQDLKDFILSYRIGTVEVMNDALLECRNNFAEYWGQQLVNGLRALHNLTFGDVDLSEDAKKKEAEKKDDKEQIDSPDWILKQQFKNFRGE
ncbi:DUF5063 domain-containing protein [Prolixibacter denitrificans]|uniref:DUF5063 domain-containing protein n=1 Tax=Prolixibacter denitrificans TaxID=1541063 RepID=A0A2P8CCG7_9BACT|nr:DUF5063 domain-containing protein [Prolixibacter denitrificans]PSK82660.1 uncharacterized protein DUF5063 [Prolixibacter denitrificans]GET21518.1 DUF5063 domain-containing protein [Prolixibacter denitrificans]